MAATGRAGDLDALHTPGIIFMPGYGTWDGCLLVKESW